MFWRDIAPGDTGADVQDARRLLGMPEGDRWDALAQATYGRMAGTTTLTMAAAAALPEPGRRSLGAPPSWWVKGQPANEQATTIQRLHERLQVPACPIYCDLLQAAVRRWQGNNRYQPTGVVSDADMADLF